jgi:hypothetical protein
MGLDVETDIAFAYVMDGHVTVIIYFQIVVIVTVMIQVTQTCVALLHLIKNFHKSIGNCQILFEDNFVYSRIILGKRIRSEP